MSALHKILKLLKWQFILILAICRRTLLWRDEIWSSNNCGKARVTADLCFCVFVASLYQPKQNNRNLILLSTDAANLGAWSFHYKHIPTSSVTYVYLPQPCREQGMGNLWSWYEHLFSSFTSHTRCGDTRRTAVIQALPATMGCSGTQPIPLIFNYKVRFFLV